MPGLYWLQKHMPGSNNIDIQRLGHYSDVLVHQKHKEIYPDEQKVQANSLQWAVADDNRNEWRNK